MSQIGQSRRFGTPPATSGLPQSTDFVTPAAMREALAGAPIFSAAFGNMAICS
jgi:hypothetical protein